LDTEGSVSDFQDRGIDRRLAAPVMTTVAPSAVKTLADARPMPLLPPVIKAILPANRIVLNPSTFQEGLEEDLEWG
jgi:hypothetical protein